MLVKQLLCDVLRMTGRADAAELCESGRTDEATERALHAVLLCVNAVADELARGYFPLRAEEDMSSAAGEYAFSSFAHMPCRIISVNGDRSGSTWAVRPLRLVCGCTKARVEYEYVPERFESGDEFSYPDPAVGAYLVCLGAAAEYLLIEGDVACAEMWERKYREEIDRQLSLSPAGGKIPPRRWL